MTRALLLALLLATGCGGRVVVDCPWPEDDVAAFVDAYAVAFDVHLDPLEVRCSAGPAVWAGHEAMGMTPRAGLVLVGDVEGRALADSVLAHELAHAALWEATGDGDAAHLRADVYALAEEMRIDMGGGE